MNYIGTMVRDSETKVYYCRSDASMELVKVHMRRTPIATMSSWSILQVGRHDSKYIYIVTMNGCSDQESPTWVKTKGRYGTGMCPELGYNSLGHKIFYDDLHITIQYKCTFEILVGA